MAQFDTDTGAERGRTSNRGFAGMDKEKQREIARKGGRAAHEQGTAHEFTSEEARAAGRKGGQARQSHRRSSGESSERVERVENPIDETDRN